jgi:hypothetical protein
LELPPAVLVRLREHGEQALFGLLDVFRTRFLDHGDLLTGQPQPD